MSSKRGGSISGKTMSTPKRLSGAKRPSSESMSASKRVKRVPEVEVKDTIKEEEGPKASLQYPYQYLISKQKMVKIQDVHEGVLSVITASPDETFMTKRQSTENKTVWQGPYAMWKDTKQIQLAVDESRGTELVMVMPGENESHRSFDHKLVHVPNLRACAIVDNYRGPWYLGGNVENAICGTVYIIERVYDDDIDYDAIKDDKTELPLVDISNDHLVVVRYQVWDEDDDDDDEDDDEE